MGNPTVPNGCPAFQDIASGLRPTRSKRDGHLGKGSQAIAIPDCLNDDIGRPGSGMGGADRPRLDQKVARRQESQIQAYAQPIQITARVWQITSPFHKPYGLHCDLLQVHAGRSAHRFPFPYQIHRTSSRIWASKLRRSNIESSGTAALFQRN